MRWEVPGLLLLLYCPGHEASRASDVSKMVKIILYVQVKNIKTAGSSNFLPIEVQNRFQHCRTVES